MRGKIDLRPPGAYQAEADAKAHQVWLREHGPGPETARCDECGAFAPYAFHDESYCKRHAPAHLIRPGDFLEAPQP